MGKTTIQQKKNQYVITNKLNHPEAIIERELHLVSDGFFKHLLPVYAEYGKKSVTLTCSVEGMMTLDTYFSGIVSKKMFLMVVDQLISIVKQCEEDRLNATNLVLHMDYIFLDPITKRLKCVFWPIVNNQQATNIAEFLKELPFQIVFNRHEDLDYVTTYLNYFKGHGPFSIKSFEKMIHELMGKGVEKTPSTPFGTTGNEREEAEVEKEEKKEAAGQIAYNPFEQIKNNHAGEQGTKLCSNCNVTYGTEANFCPSCGARLTTSIEKESDGTTVLGVEETGGTTVLGSDELAVPIFPHLIRQSTEEKIIVDKPSFRIGKEKRYCDYFISDNSAISRSHADILTKNDRYFIIDNNSTNKTYVDGRVVPVQKEVEIFSGTKIKLANEEFVFYV